MGPSRRRYATVALYAAFVLFVLFLPFVPIQTSYPPQAVVRDDCGGPGPTTCFGIAPSSAIVSPIFVLSEGNLGFMGYDYQHIIFVACNPMAGVGAAHPCLADWV